MVRSWLFDDRRQTWLRVRPVCWLMVVGLLLGGMVGLRWATAAAPDVGSLPSAASPAPRLLVAVLAASKSDTLIVDANGNGVAEAGDTLGYTVTIANSGNTAATTVQFTDTPDPNTTLVAGSVQTSQGTVTGGNTGTPPVVVAVGTLASNASATITFRVRINAPLPAGVTQISNQGSITSSEYPAISTDDPDQPGTSDPTETPVVAAPQLSASKSDALVIDTDANGSPSAGDTLQYQVTIRNTGNSAAPNVQFSDSPDSNTTLVTGSVQTSQGTITGGNTGTPPVVVAVGTLAGNTSATITFRVRINAPLGAGVTQLINQGTVISTATPSVVTDDPDTPTLDDPTLTAVTAAPALTADKRDTLFTDLNGDGLFGPGDVVVYQITIRNAGNAASTAITVIDTPDANTTLISGTVQTSQGTVTGGNTGTPLVAVDVGTLAAGAQVIISFQVRINAPVASGVSQISNQATVNSAPGPIQTNDPDTSAPGDATVSSVAATPDLRVTKRDDAQFVDPGTPGGAIIVYTLTYTNTGNQNATNARITDTVPLNTTFNAVSSTPGWECPNRSGGGTPCPIRIGSIPAGASGTVQFAVVVNFPLPGGVSQISNTAIIRDDGLNGPDPTPGNNTATESTPFNPTALVLQSFTATYTASRITVRWVTTAEIDTASFNIHRSITNERSTATVINRRNGQGRGGQGASYELIDQDIRPGTTYYYWLEEVEVDDGRHFYGPVSASSTPTTQLYRVVLPFVRR